ncbi:beta-glucosidase 38 [Oryza brachyantha]|uniref:beta-glucosidase n=1 Tax=Oryza brachyantha TaxID=4533 RepID=J3NCZ8_ORYBR|nr:beta-glucosidase 38 [Oryza brachyantha]
MKKEPFLLPLVLAFVSLWPRHAHGKLGEHTDLTRASFPLGFVFGTASSAYQVEGNALKYGRGPCIWDTFLLHPGKTPDNATANVTVDEYHRYMDDVDNMVRVGFDAYRFSISWSRIFPSGIGRINKDGVDYYHRLIDYMLAHSITPYVALYHYDLPQVLHDQYNGWLHTRVVRDFVRFADFCFKTYGHKVKNWFTINEPRMMANHGYGDGYFAPGRCTGCQFGGNSATEPYITAHNLLLSHAAAVKIYRDKYQATQKGKIGILLDFVWYEPLTDREEDRAAAHRAREFTLGWFLHPITYGHYPETMQNIVMRRLPNFTREQSEMIKGSADYIGINHYTTYYVSHHVNKTFMSYLNDWDVKISYERDGVPIGKQAYSNWLYVVPWGIYKAVMHVKEKYKDPIIIIGENGIDQPGNDTLPGALYDSFRIEYFDQYLHELKRAITDGAKVIGYFAWSLLDNFEWRLGFTSKFGIVYVDRQTFTRYPKDSTRWFRKVIKNEV